MAGNKGERKKLEEKKEQKKKKWSSEHFSPFCVLEITNTSTDRCVITETEWMGVC